MLANILKDKYLHYIGRDIYIQTFSLKIFFMSVINFKNIIKYYILITII